jgi:hypothetical protein
LSFSRTYLVSYTSYLAVPLCPKRKLDGYGKDLGEIQICAQISS